MQVDAGVGCLGQDFPAIFAIIWYLEDFAAETKSPLKRGGSESIRKKTARPAEY